MATDSDSSQHASRQAGLRLLGLASGKQSFRKAEVAALLAVPADLTVQNEQGEGILHEALRNHHLGLFREALVAGADPNLRARDGESVLQRAVMSGRLDEVRMLIDAGADLHLTDEAGTNVPLEMAFITLAACRTMAQSDVLDGRISGDKGSLADWENAIDVLEEMVRLLMMSGARVDETSLILDGSNLITEYRKAATEALDRLALYGSAEHITAETICIAASMGRERELLKLPLWEGKDEALREVMAGLPPYLFKAIIEEMPEIHALLKPGRTVTQCTATSARVAEPESPERTAS